MRGRSREGPTRAAGLACVVFLFLGAGQEPPGPADWPVPLDSSVPVRWYDSAGFVRVEEEVETVVDLEVWGGDEGRPGPLFYQPRELTVNQAGMIFVVDAGNKRVEMFDPSGKYLGGFGRAGRGPGEFASPLRIATYGGGVAVYDRGYGRISTWTDAGEHRDDWVPDWPVSSSGALESVGDSLLAVAQRFSPGPWLRTTTQTVALLSPRERTVTVVAERTRPFDYQREEGKPTQSDLGWNDRRLVVSTDPLRERFYLASRHEYSIVAFSASRHEPDWGLHVRMPDVPYPRERYDSEARTAMIWGDRHGIASFNQIDKPEFVPDLAIIPSLVDGHGHLYVFPDVDAAGVADAPDAGAKEPERKPVDIYDVDGQLLFTGWYRGPFWKAALGDFVYDIGIGDNIPVAKRMRLIEPF